MVNSLIRVRASLTTFKKRGECSILMTLLLHHRRSMEFGPGSALPDQGQKLVEIDLARLLHDLVLVSPLQSLAFPQERGEDFLELRLVQGPATGIVPFGDLAQGVSRAKGHSRPGSLPSQPADQPAHHVAAEAANETAGEAFHHLRGQ